MTDERSRAAVTSWLRDTDASTHDLNESVRRAMANVRRTPQLGRWRLLPSLGRAQASAPTTSDTAEYQPNLIPATNGRNPTVIGRASSMFSPARAVIVGALVFAIGGALLIAGPFGQQGGGVPGAATDAPAGVDDGGLSIVTGHLLDSYYGQGGDGGENLPLIDGLQVRFRDGSNGGRLEMDDARLSGDVTFTMNIDFWDTDKDPAGDASLWWGTMRIENDGGTWEGTHLHPHQHALRADANPPVMMQLVGSEEYEGLSAILYWYQDVPDSGDPALKSGEWMTGMIFPGDLPPADRR